MRIRQRACRALGIGLVVAVVAGLAAFGLRRAAAAPRQNPSAIVQCDVPSGWGAYRGAALGGLVFEDSAGTLRVVDCSSHAPIVAYQIRRTTTQP